MHRTGRTLLTILLSTDHEYSKSTGRTASCLPQVQAATHSTRLSSASTQAEQPTVEPSCTGAELSRHFGRRMFVRRPHAVEPAHQYGDGPRVMAEAVAGTFEEAQFGVAVGVDELAGI